MSAAQKSLKDVCDLLEELIAGGSTSTDIYNILVYLTHGETYNLKTVVDELSQSNTDTAADLAISLAQLFTGTDLSFGQSVLVEGGQTAAQLLTLIESILQTSYNELVNITGYTAIIQNVYTELTTISANTAFTERLTRQFNYRAFMDSALIPAAGLPAAIQFSGSAGFGLTENNFVKATVQNRSDRDLVIYDSVSNPMLYIAAGTSEDITGLVSLNSTYPEIYVARASGGVASGNVYLNLVYSLTAI